MTDTQQTKTNNPLSFTKSHSSIQHPHSTQNIGAIYGDTLLHISPKHSKRVQVKTNPAYRMPFCHQSVFVKTALLKQHHFDTSFKICADNAFFTSIYKAGVRFCYIDSIVSIYDAHGLSSKPSLTYLKEELRIIAKVNTYYALPFLCKYLFMLLKFGIKCLLPQTLAYKIQSVYNAK